MRVLKKSVFKQALLQTTLPLSVMIGFIGTTSPAFAQVSLSQSNKNDLAKDSPFRDPDIIYLEADELINNEDLQTLTAVGEVEGRYQNRTLRADSVLYNLATGAVTATGNVVLVDSTGSSQFADKLELSNELEAGTASNFTARMAGGGVTSAAFATRTSDEEIELFNAFYTACEPCREKGKTRKPAWRIKARKVRQDSESRTVRYNDAVFELLGLPVFYTPYLAHPDPSADRASGLLSPLIGITSNKGLGVGVPYFWALDNYTDVTLTPQVYSKVNPLLGYEVARKFNTGQIDIEGSFTYSSFFDEDGDLFDPAEFVNPDDAPLGKRLRSNIYAKGLFNPNETWTYGFGLQLTTDDNYLNRYDREENPASFGLYESESRRNISQAFLVGQDDSFRFTTSTFGFQDLRTSFVRSEATDLISVFSPNDRELPIIAPKIEFEKYIDDPIAGGRLRSFGDATILTRDIGTNYARLTGGLDYNKTFIAPGGVEVKPFGNLRYDYFDINPEDQITNADNSLAFDDVSFSRTLGQVGVDVRYPFIKSGANVDFIIEPRAQVTQSFGDGKLDEFTINDTQGNELSLFQDGINVDFDQALLWQTNKSTGFDFWQEGLRADVGASFIADWKNSRAQFFLGKSFASDISDSFAIGSGLEGTESDFVGQFELDLNRKFKWTTRVRYDEKDNDFRRIDSGFSYNSKWLSTNWRYFRLDASASELLDNPGAPQEGINGSARLRLTDRWGLSYRASRDIDAGVTQVQSLGLAYQDDCTLIELLYTQNNFASDNNRGSDGIGIRVSLLTLGEFGG